MCELSVLCVCARCLCLVCTRSCASATPFSLLFSRVPESTNCQPPPIVECDCMQYTQYLSNIECGACFVHEKHWWKHTFKNQQQGGDKTEFEAPFSFNRMTWIKPSYLWLMSRSNWGTKSNQEYILGIEIYRSAWEKALSKALVKSKCSWLPNA